MRGYFWAQFIPISSNFNGVFYRDKCAVFLNIHGLLSWNKKSRERTDLLWDLFSPLLSQFWKPKKKLIALLQSRSSNFLKENHKISNGEENKRFIWGSFWSLLPPLAHPNISGAILVAFIVSFLLLAVNLNRFTKISHGFCIWG